MAGVVLAAVPIAWAVITALSDFQTEREYVTEADRECAKYRPALQSLGPEPWQGDQETYTRYLRQRVTIIRSALKDWGDVKMPPSLQEKVNDSYFAADSAAVELEAAVDWATAGNTDKANDHIDESRGLATDAIRGARSAGLRICPLGF
ncbi:hypothetical protein [Streptomyces purpurogeneiscleroticus]|uniref:hypothetical protein n=1 Tax=Streptomyces purpurogeneiscleroticus TaxID=68259 RepID=UPI001CBE88FA|nr:hypothetical protein [Streptomyces purpurogeneiscleroticus]